MTLQRLTMRLTELRCIAQSEGSGGSEPYLWVTYFAHGAEPAPQPGPVHTITPAYDAFRTEFPDGVAAGQAVAVPPFLAEAHFDFDLQRDYKLVGCVAVLMEEDSTPQSSIVLGRIAYAKEIDKQINELAMKRIQTGNDSPLTPEELNKVRAAVKAAAEEAIGSDQSIWDFFRNQDDHIGFTYAALGDEALGRLAASGTGSEPLEFDEITNSGSDRFALSGVISITSLPGETIDLCAAPRAALKAKTGEIQSLQTRRQVLQQELHNAAPSQKAAIVAEIGVTNDAITLAEAELPALQSALEECTSRHGIDTGERTDRPQRAVAASLSDSTMEVSLATFDSVDRAE